MNLHPGHEYRRYVAILQEDNKNYAITSTRRPQGKVIIEIQGNNGQLLYSVKNLRLINGEEKEYGIWIIANEKKRKYPVYIGPMTINNEGTGVGRYDFNLTDIERIGFDIDSFDMVEINVHKLNRNTPEKRVVYGQLELEEITLPEEPKMEKVTPFGANLPYYQWWKFYPGYFQDWMNYPVQPSASECVGSHGNALNEPVFRGHHLIGLKYDQNREVKFLVHGIPGRFCLRDQPYEGMTGYVYWHPLPGQKYKAGDYGYWLIHINPRTGEVVFPKKVTKPPDCDECLKNSKK